jgi:hypothetical protein
LDVIISPHRKSWAVIIQLIGGDSDASEPKGIMIFIFRRSFLGQPVEPKRTLGIPRSVIILTYLPYSLYIKSFNRACVKMGMATDLEECGRRSAWNLARPF